MKLVPILFITLLVSCSSQIKVRPTANRFMTAEAQGKSFAGDASFHITRGTEVSIVLSEDDLEEPLETETTSSIDTILPSFSSSFGIYGPVDLYYTTGGGSGAPLLGAKLQLWGDHRKQAQAYNFSVALYAAGGATIVEQENDEAIELVATDEEATTDLTVGQTSIGALVSYRLEPKLIATLGYHINKMAFYGDLESDSVTIDGQHIHYDGLSHLLTLGMRFEVGSIMLFNLEISNEQTKWDHTDRIWNTFINGNVGFVW